MKSRINNFFSTFFILFWIFLFVLLLYNSFSYLDPDFGWHLRAGQYAINNQKAPIVNQYNYTLAGEEWVNHEWLIDAWTYLLYNNIGYIGINVFFALLVVVVLFLVYNFTKWSNNNNEGSEILMMILMLLGVVAMLPHLGVRMQEVTLLGLFLLLFLLYKFEQTKKLKILLWLIPLFFLWANIHAGFLIGLFLMFSYGVIKAVELLLFNKDKDKWHFIDFKNVLKAEMIIKYFIVAFLGWLVTLFTPYGWKLYEFLSGYTNSFYLTHINEWLPQYFLPLRYGQIFYLAVVVAILFLFFIHALSTKEKKYKINLWQIFLVVLFTALAYKSRRHFPLLFIVSFPFVINFCLVFFDLRTNVLKTRISKPLKIFLLTVIILSSAQVVLATNFSTKPFSNYCSEYPCQAVSFLKQKRDLHNLKMFNYYGWGGYLIWTYPQGRLFIDGRLPQYQINNSTMLEEYYKFFKENMAKTMLDKYDVDIVLFKKSSKDVKYDWFERFVFLINKREVANKNNKLLDFLRANNKWENIFENELSLVFIKKQVKTIADY